MWTSNALLGKINEGMQMKQSQLVYTKAQLYISPAANFLKAKCRFVVRKYVNEVSQANFFPLANQILFKV